MVHMTSPRHRVSRTIRARISKRRQMRAARDITIDRKGLLIEGQRFPYWVGAEVGIRHLGNLNILEASILTENVTVRGPLGRHTKITESWD